MHGKMANGWKFQRTRVFKYIKLILVGLGFYVVIKHMIKNKTIRWILQNYK